MGECRCGSVAYVPLLAAAGAAMGAVAAGWMLAWPMVVAIAGLLLVVLCVPLVLLFPGRGLRRRMAGMRMAGLLWRGMLTVAVMLTGLLAAMGVMIVGAHTLPQSLVVAVAWLMVPAGLFAVPAVVLRVWRGWM